MSDDKRLKGIWRLLLVGVVLGSVITVGASWIFPSEFDQAKKSVVNTVKNLDWDWTGFGEGTIREETRQKKDKDGPFTETTKYQSGKTLWDLLELAGTLAVPTLIAVLGYQFQQRQKEAEQILKQNQLRSEIRTDYLKRLGVLYREVKAARRSLRAAGLTTKFESPPNTLSEAQADAYKEEMLNLNHAQLELEALKIEAKNLPAFASINQLPGDLKDMEEYLRQILSEYEKNSPILDSGKSIRWRQLEYLDEFTKKRTALTYRSKLSFSDFSERYDHVIKLISQDLFLETSNLQRSSKT